MAEPEPGRPEDARIDELLEAVPLGVLARLAGSWTRERLRRGVLARGVRAAALEALGAELLEAPEVRRTRRLPFVVLSGRRGASRGEPGRSER